jgi:hypothetical protein
MNRLHAAIGFFSCLLLLTAAALGQDKTIRADPDDIANPKIWKVVNRQALVVQDTGKRAIRFDEKKGPGIAWIEGTDFTEGTIEVDIKGRNVSEKSLLGVVFRGVDTKTYDAVFFRPFNFKSEDPELRTHAVQYVSQPDYTWERLRQEKQGVYEKGLDPAPDPDGWFRARLVLANRKVSVFINEATEPSLVVDELTDRPGGWVGLWVGEGSGGRFANLKITPLKAQSGNKLLRLGGSIKDRVKIPK